MVRIPSQSLHAQMMTRARWRGAASIIDLGATMPREVPPVVQRRIPTASIWLAWATAGAHLRNAVDSYRAEHGG